MTMSHQPSPDCLPYFESSTVPGGREEPQILSTYDNVAYAIEQHVYAHATVGYEAESSGPYAAVGCTAELSDNYLTMVELLHGNPAPNNPPVNDYVNIAPMTSDSYLHELPYHTYAQNMVPSLDAYASTAEYHDGSTYGTYPFHPHSAYVQNPMLHESSSSSVAPSLIPSHTPYVTAPDAQCAYPFPSYDAQSTHPSFVAYASHAPPEAPALCIAPSLVATSTPCASAYDAQDAYPSPSPSYDAEYAYSASPPDAQDAYPSPSRDAEYAHPSSSHGAQDAYPSPSYDAEYALSASSPDAQDAYTAPSYDAAHAHPSSSPDVQYACSSSSHNAQDPYPSPSYDAEYASSAASPAAQDAYPSSSYDAAQAHPSSSPDVQYAHPSSSPDVQYAYPASSHKAQDAYPTYPASSPAAQDAYPSPSYDAEYASSAASPAAQDAYPSPPYDAAHAHPSSSQHIQYAYTSPSPEAFAFAHPSHRHLIAPYPTPSPELVKPRSDLRSCKRRNVQVQVSSSSASSSSSRTSASRSAVPRNRWKCPHCPHVQHNRRGPDLRRHIATHSKQKWVCCGVPLIDAKALGVPFVDGVLADGLGATIWVFDGIVMVGGCRTTFSRRDAYGRHLKREKGMCWGDMGALYQPGNRGNSDLHSTSS